MNQLHEVVIRDQLKVAKEELREKEVSGDVLNLETCMKRVMELQEARKKNPYTTEFLHQK